VSIRLQPMQWGLRPIRQSPETPFSAYTAPLPILTPTPRNDSFQLRFGGVSRKLVVPLPFERTKPDLSNVVLISGSSNPKLAQQIAKELGGKLADVTLSKHANGEAYVRINANLNGKDVYIIQSTSPPVDYHEKQFQLLCDAAKAGFAQSITGVVPHLGYSRGDGQVLPGESNAALVAFKNLTNHGTDRIITFELHAKQLKGYFNSPSAPLDMNALVVGYVKARKLDLDNLVVVSPDYGATKRDSDVASALNQLKLQQAAPGAPVSEIPVVILNKERNLMTHELKGISLKGDPKLLEGKTLLVVDDLLDTAGTLCEGAEKLAECKPARIIAIAPQGLFSSKPPKPDAKSRKWESATDKLLRSKIDEVIVTDALPLPRHTAKLKNLTVISSAPLIAEAIARFTVKKSLNDMIR
jgi:ribose-phosphate pyrophosphokinase